MEVCDSTKDRASKSNNGGETFDDSEENQVTEATCVFPSVNEHRIDSVNMDSSKANTDIEQSNESSNVQSSRDKGYIDKSNNKKFSWSWNHLDQPPIRHPPLVYIESESNTGSDNHPLQGYYVTGNDFNTVSSEENQIVSCPPTLSPAETSTQGQYGQFSSDLEDTNDSTCDTDDLSYSGSSGSSSSKSVIDSMNLCNNAMTYNDDQFIQMGIAFFFALESNIPNTDLTWFNDLVKGMYKEKQADVTK